MLSFIHYQIYQLSCMRYYIYIKFLYVKIIIFLILFELLFYFLMSLLLKFTKNQSVIYFLYAYLIFFIRFILFFTYQFFNLFYWRLLYLLRSLRMTLEGDDLYIYLQYYKENYGCYRDFFRMLFHIKKYD